MGSFAFISPAVLNAQHSARREQAQQVMLLVERRIAPALEGPE